MTIEDEIAARRSVSFSEYQELCLYHPEFGFYERDGRAGRDFLTSVELGSVFAEVIARALDNWWLQFDRPREFHFVEVGASRGTFASQVVSQQMQCREALRYIGVERSAALRSQWTASVPVVEDMPTDLRDSSGVVFCNELFDNIATDIYDDRDQLRVRMTNGRPGWHRRVVGRIFPEQQRCSRWLDGALKTFARGRLVAVDYMRTTGEMRGLPPGEWLRGYRNQQRRDVFDAPGECDVTCDVALDQLRWVKTPRATSTQARFLEMHGIDEIELAAREQWNADAALGGLAGLQARSRLIEIEALTDPKGLGGFTVVEWNCA